jgi:Type I phosphodiesterase / nucleotide pyrophosphatase
LKRLLVINCAALSADIARNWELERCGDLYEVNPVFPALTVPAQATFLTGTLPGSHGGVGNGFYCKTLRKPFFWEQSADLIQGRRLWTQLEEDEQVLLHAGLLFHQNSVGSNADYMVTPAPLHMPDGRTVSVCQTRPVEMSQRLDAKLGPFPLHNYWGPMAGLDSSRWIVEATKLLLESSNCQMLFTYIPHLDYDLQRFGPDSEQAGKAVKVLVGLISELLEVAMASSFIPVILGDYTIEQATGCLKPNIILSQAGLLSLRSVEGRQVPDYGSSGALALVDHQIAHVYCQNGVNPQQVAEHFKGLEGIARILQRPEQEAAGIAHYRTGDLLLEAAPGFWFAYDWWTDEQNAPPYANTVDIHNKPGYDPLELFFSDDHKGIARDHSLIKGTHGRSGGGKTALMLPNGTDLGDAADGPLAAADVTKILGNLVLGNI